MEYRTGRRFTGLKRLWRLRYRAYAVMVIFFSVFIVTQDTPNAVKTLVSADSLNYQITDQNIFAKKILEFTGATKTTATITSIVYKNDTSQFVDSNKKLVTEGVEYNRYKNYGYVLRPPTVSFAAIVGQPSDQSGTGALGVIPAAPPELNDIVRAPQNPDRTNFIDYPRFNIKAPIEYTTPEDVYNKNPDGSVDYQSPIWDDQNEVRRGNYTSTPVLKLLLDGIVHMGGIPGVPLPGELGNAYIVGHSSNYSSVASPYNEIFRPLVNRSAEGDIFYVYDQQGRKMKYKVFENVEIRFDADPEIAYQRNNADYRGRRIVTLQTCKTVWENGQGWVPTYRWLVRGELVTE